MLQLESALKRLFRKTWDHFHWKERARLARIQFFDFVAYCCKCCKMLQSLIAGCNCRNRHLEQIGQRKIWMIRTLQERLCWSPESVEIITKSLLHDVASLKAGVATLQLSLKSQKVSAPYFKPFGNGTQKPEGGFWPPPRQQQLSGITVHQSNCSVKQRRAWPPRRLRWCH